MRVTQLLSLILLLISTIVHGGQGPSTALRPSTIQLLHNGDRQYVLDMDVVDIKESPFLRFSTDEQVELRVVVASDASKEGMGRLIELIKQESKNGSVEIYVATNRGSHQLYLKKIVTKTGSLNVIGTLKGCTDNKQEESPTK